MPCATHSQRRSQASWRPLPLNNDLALIASASSGLLASGSLGSSTPASPSLNPEPSWLQRESIYSLATDVRLHDIFLGLCPPPLHAQGLSQKFLSLTSREPCHQLALSLRAQVTDAMANPYHGFPPHLEVDQLVLKLSVCESNGDPTPPGVHRVCLPLRWTTKLSALRIAWMRGMDGMTVSTIDLTVMVAQDRDVTLVPGPMMMVKNETTIAASPTAALPTCAPLGTSRP